jgi:DNA-binding CsgD family transcriptional regulator
VRGGGLWKRLDSSVLELHAVPYGPRFINGVLSVLQATISSEFCLYGISFPVERSTIFGLRHPEDIDVRKFTPVFDRYFEDHPLNQARPDVSPGAVLSVDEAGGAAWSQSGMANEFCRPNGLTHQLMLCLPTSGGYVEALGLARPDMGFSDEDRFLFEAIKGHVLLAFRKARAFPYLTEQDGDPSRAPWILERVVVDRLGGVITSTEGAQQLLREWFPRGGTLPDPVGRWVRRCLDAPADAPAEFGRRLVLSSETKYLELWLTSWSGPDSYEIYLRQYLKTRKPADDEAGERSGVPARGRDHRVQLDRAATNWQLSNRQRQVLDLVMQGLANKEVAAKLGCAEATVEFHMSGLFRSCGAESRMQLAAMFWSG